MIIKHTANGIPHIEDLPLSAFVHLIGHLDEFTVTEKVDGSQILFGLDDRGFYTSRETKGGKRVYNDEDYGLSFSSVYKRSAHRLLEQSLPILKGAGLTPGDQIEAEVLYGELPNVVPYSDNRNYLIFLRTTFGNANIDLLHEALCGQSFSISLMSPFTLDGKTIGVREETNIWEFSRIPNIITEFNQISEKLAELYLGLQKFLSISSGIVQLNNLEVNSTLLNKKPDWCDSNDWKSCKQLLKEKRKEIQHVAVDQYVLPIKELLLDLIVRNRASAYGPQTAAGGWIEGVVLRHKNTGHMVKLVDKCKFGTIRNSAWAVRNSITSRAKSIQICNSFLGNLYLSIASVIGHPELGTMQAKRYIKRFGISIEDQINNLSSEIDTVHVKTFWASLLEQKESELLGILNKYIRNTVIDDNLLTKCINDRTMCTFADTFSHIGAIKDNISNSSTPKDLLKILVGKHLDQLTCE